MSDIVGMFYDDGTLAEDSPLHTWMENADTATSKLGMTIQVQPYIESWLKDAGFTNVQQVQFKIPIGTWPRNKKEKELGAMNLVNLLSGLEGFMLTLHVNILGMTREEADIQFNRIRSALKDKSRHKYFKIHFTYGQKPQASLTLVHGKS